MIRFAFLLLPLLEIAGFIVVGQAIGLLPTLGLVLLSVVLGLLLIRQGGLGAFREAQTEARAGRHPGPRIVRGFLTVLAGILLIVPGFLSDLLAVFLLLPPVQARAWSFLQSRVRFAGGPGRRREPAAAPRVIELDRADFTARPDPESPWAKGSRGN